MSRPLRVRILDRDWKVKVMDADAFVRRFDEELAGCTVTETSEIIFNEDDISLKVVIHELTHAYYAGLCLNSSSLNLEQQEEVFAEMFETHGIALIRLARKLYKELRK